MIKTVSHCKKHQWLWVENPVSLLASLLIFIFMFSLGLSAAANPLGKVRQATDALKSGTIAPTADAPVSGQSPTGGALKPPAGFLALHEGRLSLQEATAWCQQRGGRLPLIKGLTSMHENEWRGRIGFSVDGFGKIGVNWPAGLPGDRYWTGTVNSGSRQSVWVIMYLDNKVEAGYTEHGGTRRVVCVR